MFYFYSRVLYWKPTHALNNLAPSTPASASDDWETTSCLYHFKWIVRHKCSFVRKLESAYSSVSILFLLRGWKFKVKVNAENCLIDMVIRVKTCRANQQNLNKVEYVDKIRYKYNIWCKFIV